MHRGKIEGLPQAGRRASHFDTRYDKPVIFRFDKQQVASILDVREGIVL